ncbi:hypothetical protein JANAI62_09970 [Jannaschia pagri]|uniref:Lipoprotein n=1 Tax=Jannaschia pagri TaxID=2829797 RepID=A0ABQ4NIY1_9RHOB|nr:MULTISPECIES: hypothetical protein [unclassified Jannaschia]GIT90542.1 hypothetical protein JANAI61_10000 [Jannaschia sp. AI_61]GIT94374.1 hypothetical protein JANAI62_09970 [Jannaschia sp. AI_62]
MSNAVKAVVALAALSVLGGCFLSNPEPEEIVIVEPAPVVVEPVRGKFH